jgi:hypothetical protein
LRTVAQRERQLLPGQDDRERHVTVSHGSGDERGQALLQAALLIQVVHLGLRFGDQLSGRNPG